MKLHVSSCAHLDRTTRIDVHNHTPREKALRTELVKRFPSIRPDTQCSSINYTDLLLGDMDVVIHYTKKRNLELGVFYGLIVGAGGYVIDRNGEDIGNKKYLAFGQNGYDEELVICAATRELAEQVRQLIVSCGI